MPAVQCCPRRLLLVHVRLLHNREKAALGGQSCRAESFMTPGQLGICPPSGPGVGEGRGRRPHSPALIFNFQEWRFQSGHWKGREHTLASRLLQSRACTAHTGNAQRGEALPEPKSLPELEHTLPQGAPFHSAISSSLYPGRKFHHRGRGGCRVLGMPSLSRTEDPPVCGFWRLSTAHQKPS